MQVVALPIPEVRLLTPRKFGDGRGFFSETYNRKTLRTHGIDVAFVQDNHSLSTARGTVRGLHYQIPPFAQAKLLRVLRGSIYDVVVDLRRGSPSYGRHVAVVISAESWSQIFIPVGCAHGFCTIEADTEIFYKVSARYSPEHERGIRWNDPALAIAWPVRPEEAVLSPRDAALPPFAATADDRFFSVAPAASGSA